MARDEDHEETFNEAPIGLARVGLDGSWLRVNRHLCEIFGYDEDSLSKLRFQDITHPDDLGADLAQYERVLRDGHGQYSMPKRYIRSDGSVLQAELNVRLLQDADGRGDHFIAAIQETSQTQSKLERLRHLARHDALTRILNRTGFTASLRDAYRAYLRRGAGFSVVTLDLDGFKSVNDTMGHGAGDCLLREVAQRIDDAIGRDGQAARLGGDEFAAVLPARASPDKVHPVLFRLASVFAAPFRIGGGEGQFVSMSASMGHAHCPTDATSLKALMHHADRQLYRNKRAEFTSLRSV